MYESERRQALADFLRQRRAHLTPAEVGLPAGIRRRTPGLRREEVAQLANMGTSWYVWLEQGRDVHPSAQVLESLAQALRLTPNERRHLFLLAGQPLPPHASPLEERTSPALQQVLDDLNPTPAYAVGRRWDYLAWNKAADALFAISEASSPYAHNLVWRFFTSPTMRARPNRSALNFVGGGPITMHAARWMFARKSSIQRLGTWSSSISPCKFSATLISGS